MVWKLFSRQYGGRKIREHNLIDFFSAMEPGLGMKGASKKEIIRVIVKMDLMSDDEGFIYFNDLLLKSMKRVYGNFRLINMILIECELKTYEKIIKIR